MQPEEMDRSVTDLINHRIIPSVLSGCGVAGNNKQIFVFLMFRMIQWGDNIHLTSFTLTERTKLDGSLIGL